jgi:hypothetical protein
MPGCVIKTVASVVMGLIAIGCATKRNKEPLSIPVYDLFECPQLAQEAQSVAIESAELAGLRRQAGEPPANREDMVVFWPAAFTARSENSIGAVELARLKSEFDAIQQAMLHKNCSTRFEAR